METVVLIIGAGPSGLATSACLTRFSIPHIILEKEDTYASLWKKRTYDRLKLHLAKEFCSLPHAPHPSSCPTYIPKEAFLSYLERYVTTNNINPKYNQCVVSSFYNAVEGKWVVETTDVRSGEVSVYSAKFLVIGTGENDAAYIPKLDALDTFTGEVLHSNQYKSASKYQGQNVLVVGCGNSGMEIAYDLSNYGASTSICIRSPVHVLTKELVHLAMTLLSYFPVSFVDFVILMMARLVYGDLSKYGIRRPPTGPMKNKILTGRSAVIDVGTVKKIKNKQIEVVPGILSINKNKVVFANGNEKEFDAIIFATGYRSNVTNWLKDYKFLNLNENGMPDLSKPNYWKGKNGVYCAGFSRRGLHGVSMDAQSIAADINKMVNADAVEP